MLATVSTTMTPTTLKAPCPKCSGEIQERERTFHCPACHWTLFRTILGRAVQAAEVEELLAHGRTPVLEGFRSKQGRPFQARLKLGAAPDFKTTFDFGDGASPGRGGSGTGDQEAPPDFTGQQSLGACPVCGARVMETQAAYVCEHAVAPSKSCRFQVRKVILQQAVAPEQLTKLLSTGRSELLRGFVSKKSGRPFEAVLVVKDGGVAFEFPQRAEGAKPANPRPSASSSRPVPGPAARLDFTGQQPLGKCPRCGGRVFEGEQHYVCEHSQRSPNPCAFRVGRAILEQPVSRDQVTRLLAAGRSELLAGFVSKKTGRPFSAFLVMDQAGQVNFEFPARENKPVAAAGA